MSPRLPEAALHPLRFEASLILIACAIVASGCGKHALDEDSDGWSAPEDCDDGNAQVHPDKAETATGSTTTATVRRTTAMQALWGDEDGDGFGVEQSSFACAAGPGIALEGGDCDDRDAGVHPGADELCNGVDDDCDDIDPLASILVRGRRCRWVRRR